MVRRPQAVAVLITLVLLGAGGWYYVNNQLEPFTADSLRYGDTMGYMITDGTFLASEEYVELVYDRLEDPPNFCRISLGFPGTKHGLHHQRRVDGAEHADVGRPPRCRQSSGRSGNVVAFG